MRRTVPLLITFIAGVAMIVSFFMNKGTFLSEPESRRVETVA